MTDRILLGGWGNVLSYYMGADWATFFFGFLQHSATWQGTGRFFAAAVHKGSSTNLAVTTYLFADAPRSVTLKLWLLQLGGSYVFEAGPANGLAREPTTIEQTIPFTLTHRGQGVSFNLPGRTTYALRIRQTGPGDRCPDGARRPGLALRGESGRAAEQRAAAAGARAAAVAPVRRASQRPRAAHFLPTVMRRAAPGGSQGSVLARPRKKAENSLDAQRRMRIVAPMRPVLSVPIVPEVSPGNQIGAGPLWPTSESAKNNRVFIWLKYKKTMKPESGISRSVSAWTLVVLLTATGGLVGFAAPHQISLTPIGTHSIGIFNSDGGVAEIVAHDPTSQRLFVVSAQLNQVTVLDISDPTQPSEVDGINLSPFKPNSVAVHGEVIAVAAENAVKTDAGRVFLFNNNLQPLSDVEVGALPDMLTFSPSGRWLLVANEGEPNSYGQVDSVDPEGTVSIIDLAGGAAHITQADVRTAGFSDFSLNDLKNAGVRIFGPGASPAQDLEPEYIAVSHDSQTAWVTLQENNALAIIDIPAGVVTTVVGLGLKDYSLLGNGLDPSDRDGPSGGPAIKIGNWPVKGLYQSDGIDAYKVGGNTFLVLANEGDAREWPGYREDKRVGDATYILDPAVDAILRQNAKLGRLQVSTSSGDLDGDADFDEIHCFGGRSFSIRDVSGNLIWDSGDDFEQITAELFPSITFNASHANNTPDNRSPSKGPEPESVVVGAAFGNTYAFIGLERVGGIMTYDISNPYAPEWVHYVNRRDFSIPPSQANLPSVGDLGPEGLLFIKAEDSPNGKPLVVVGNEVSGTTTIFQVNKVGRE